MPSEGVVGGGGGEFGSDACSIVHALPPICSPHSAASAETLRRLKGQIAHTKRGAKERGLGGGRKEREMGGGERGAHPSSQRCN